MASYLDILKKNLNSKSMINTVKKPKIVVSRFKDPFVDMPDISNCVITDFIIKQYHIIIQTNLGNISFQIMDDKLCCENFGIAISVNNNCAYDSSLIKDCVIDGIDFKNAKTQSIFLKKNIKNLDYDEIDSQILASIKTNVGTIKIIIYNMHNSYYPHWWNINILESTVKGAI
jgi:hypothetical protein